MENAKETKEIWNEDLDFPKTKNRSSKASNICSKFKPCKSSYKSVDPLIPYPVSLKGPLLKAPFQTQARGG